MSSRLSSRGRVARSISMACLLMLPAVSCASNATPANVDRTPASPSVPSVPPTEPAAPALSPAQPDAGDDARLQAFTELEAAVEAHPEAYAGLSSSGEGGFSPVWVVVHLAGTTEVPTADVLAAMSSASAAGIKVTVDRQRYSLSELDAFMDTILQSPPLSTLAKGTELVRWGVNVDTQSIEIGVVEPNDALREDVSNILPDGPQVNIVKAEQFSGAGGFAETPSLGSGDG